LNLALFGGTFDPVHRGHLAVAEAARKRFNLKQIHFVPAWVPPHKTDKKISGFSHRYAMLTLATAGDGTSIPSLLEAPPEQGDNVLHFRRGEDGKPRPNYTIETVRRVERNLKKSDKLFLIIGIDAFMDIATWYRADDLLQSVEFIIASRPGFSMADVANALPESMRPAPEVSRAFTKQRPQGTIVTGGATLHLLDKVAENVSSTNIRAAVQAGRPLKKYVPEAVADYIKKQHLYK
jgi:nicotinate-nucleotide adenylyltransferase